MGGFITTKNTMNVDETAVSIQMLKMSIQPVIPVDWSPLDKSETQTMEMAMECVKRGMAREIQKRVKQQERQSRNAGSSQAVLVMIRMMVNQRLSNNGLEDHHVKEDDLDAYLIEVAEESETASTDMYAKWRKDHGFL